MANPSPDLNLRIERRDIRGAAAPSPTYHVRVLVNDRDVVLTKEQREAALVLLDAMDPSRSVEKEPKPG